MIKSPHDCFQGLLSLGSRAVAMHTMLLSDKEKGMMTAQFILLACTLLGDASNSAGQFQMNERMKPVFERL